MTEDSGNREERSWRAHIDSVGSPTKSMKKITKKGGRGDAKRGREKIEKERKSEKW